AGIIRDRELAVQEARKFEQQIVQAKSQAELEKQKALADQNRLKVAAETERIRMKITAEQGKVEKTIAAKTELDVAKVALDSARADAEALLKLAEAERRVVEAGNKAAADVLKQQVAVYRDEADYVRAKLYEKVAPNIQSVLASDAGGGFLGLPVGYKDKHPAPPPVAAPAKKGGSEQ
ncbi:MAG: hypothetical protein GX748_19165, partial [Lentisphaerae bacterium]|nr:hypothetical protein [Lentisphaerota bacterium]